MKKEKRYPIDRPFGQIIRKDGETFFRVRQATEQGYVDCPVGGAVDISYPTSPYRRGRLIGGGKIVATLNASDNGMCLFVKIEEKWNQSELINEDT